MNRSINSKNNHGFGIVEVILVIVVVGIIGAVGWVYLAKQKTPETQPTPVSSKPVSTTKPAETTTTTYNDEAIGVRFSYPKNWVTLKCDGRPYSIYLASDNIGIGKQNDSSILCGGGTDFPPQVSIQLKTESKRGAELVQEYTRGGSSFIQELTIDGKKAYKFFYLANGQIGGIRPDGFELTTYAIETAKGVLEVDYNQWPKAVKDYDTSDVSKADFIKIVESLKFL